MEVKMRLHFSVVFRGGVGDGLHMGCTGVRAWLRGPKEKAPARDRAHRDR